MSDTATRSATLRVGVIGAGVMGQDHITRLHERVRGATVAAVVDADPARAEAAAAGAPGAVALTSLDDAMEHVDALLIATPGQFHADALIAAIDHGLPTLCEKPLTLDTASAVRVLDHEQKLERPLIQVGFMRRFDAGYVRLKELIDSRSLGDVLLLHCRHRNPSSHLVNSEELLIRDSATHELDIIAWLLGEPITEIEVRKSRRTRHANEGLHDPQMVLLRSDSGVEIDVEVFMNARFGYQVSTEAVFEDGVARIGEAEGMRVSHDGQFAVAESPSFVQRFAPAYDAQVERWVAAAREGTIAGPSVWDGYLAVVASDAGVRAQASGQRVKIEYLPRPSLYS